MRGTPSTTPSSVSDLNKVALRRLPEGTRKEDVVGKRITEIYPDIKETKWYPAYLEVLRTGETYNVEGPSVGIQSNLWLLASAFKVDEGLGVISRDVTRRRQLEERLQRAEIIAAVEQMGATVAHDLRGPLGQIVQATTLVKRDPTLTPHMLQLIEESATRSLRMIADWRSSTREIIPQPIKTDLSELIKNASNGVSKPDGVDAETSVDEGLDEVIIDPDIMRSAG